MMISFVWLSVALNSSAFNNHADDSWCASVGREHGFPALYENIRTDNLHYVCQYDSK